MTLTDTTRRKIVIIGGGMTGLSVMAHIFKTLRHPNVTIIEPSLKHEYPPLWPFVATGLADAHEAQRDFCDFLPEGSKWVCDTVKKIDQNDHIVETQGGQKIHYEYLVVCPNMDSGYGKIKGIDEAFEAGQLCSTHGLEESQNTFQVLSQLKTGTMIFSQPQGAREDGRSIHLAFLVDDMLRAAGIRDQIKLLYTTAAPTLFPVESQSKALESVAQRKGIEIRTSLSLTRMHPEEKQAEFGEVNEKGKISKETELIDCELLHIAPLLTPPASIAKNRKIAAARGDDKGKLKVDLETLQHGSYPQIFGLGESLALPIPPSAEAFRKQAEVVGYNVVAALQGKGAGTYKRYNGHTVLPITTEKGKVLSIELTYPNEAQEPAAPGPENALQWWCMRYIIPRLYWFNMQRGRA